ncbi:MAG: Ig-like domain-containing protein [Gemmatimonadales bacterium]
MPIIRQQPPKLLFLLLALSCGGGDSVTSPGGDDGPGNGGPPPPFAVVQTDPTDGATEVETGATLVARFNRAPDPASLAPGSFTVALGGVSLPARVIHEVGSADVTLVAPLLPSVELDYEATVGTEVRDPNGQALAEPHRWSFRTRGLQRVVIPTDGVDGEETSLALDNGGGVHASHVGGGAVTYSTCGAACTDASSWRSAVLGPGGRSTSIQLDATGRRHLAYYGANNELRYATCAALCESPASWTMVTVDPDIDGDLFVSLVLDGADNLHLAYYDGNSNGLLKYAVCSVGCAESANWATTVPDLPGDFGAASLAIDGAGRRHLVYYDDALRGLRYATCLSDCLGNGWQAGTVDPTDGAGVSTAIVVGRDDRLHVAYHADASDNLRYASCAGACGSAAAWQTTILDAVPDAGEFVAIALDRYERLYLTYWHSSGGVESLRFATCATDCADAASWQRTTMDGSGRVGRYSAVAVDPQGRIHATYYDGDRGDLKYVE